MDLTNEIRQMVLKSSSSGEMREVAVRNGMHSLSDDGWRLIGMGITTPEEVMRVAKDQSLGSGKNGHTPTAQTEFTVEQRAKVA
jgi:hypothetical protein